MSEATIQALDPRPYDCRFRAQQEGRPYPRSSCTACGKTILTGLGRRCAFDGDEITTLRAQLEQVTRERDEAREREIKEVAREHQNVCTVTRHLNESIDRALTAEAALATAEAEGMRKAAGIAAECDDRCASAILDAIPEGK